MKITLGITTYNRLDYIKKMCLSLRNTNGLESCSIRIYDDCSTDFDTRALRREFPFVTEYRRRKSNLGADHNIRQMYVDFLETDDDVLVNCDSDMIFRSDWIDTLKELFPLTDGVLSLYNSGLHRPIAFASIDHNEFIQKETIGSAGTVFSRSIVEDIVTNVKPSYKYDWDWSNLLTSKGIRLLVTENSYIQHIGIRGENCDACMNVDYGLNFFPMDEDTLRLNIAFFEQVIAANQSAVEQKNKFYYFKFQTPKYKILQCIIEPLSLLKRKFLASNFCK